MLHQNLIINERRAWNKWTYGVEFGLQFPGTQNCG